MSSPTRPFLVKLGKLPPRYDTRTLRLAHYVEKRKLPKIPQAHNLSRKTAGLLGAAYGLRFPFGMFMNDERRDCTCAAKAHMRQSFSAFGGLDFMSVPSVQDVLEAYGRINGGVDEGASMLDALNDWRHAGMAGNTIYAYASVDPLNHDQVRTAHFLFGGLYVGANLPASAMEQKDWSVVEGSSASPGSWGGHCMNLVDYDKKGVVFVTWGQLQRATWDWWDRYVDEVYAVLEEDYLGPDRRSPQGFSLAALAADLKRL